MKLNEVKISTLLACGFAALVVMVVFMAGFGLLKVKNANLSPQESGQ
jgi:hypothetical protein